MNMLTPFARIGLCIALVASVAVVAGCGTVTSNPRPPAVSSSGASAEQARVCPGQRVDTDAALGALAVCTQISGDLVVRRTNVGSLGSLSRLTSVVGRLEVSENLHLRSLAGLENLRRVGELVLTKNPRLTNVAALAQLARTRSVVLEDLPSLESTSGLEDLRALDSLTVSRTGLPTLRGLEGLQAVRHLHLERNGKLVSVRQLSGIRRAETIEIRGNPLLYGGPEEFFPQLAQVQAIVMSENGAISRREAESFAGRVAMSQPTSP